MRPFVELEGVGVSYGEVRVLDGINLTVEPGDFLGIIGPNGSGKTTLLRVMLGLLVPQEGSVRLFGQPPASFREWRRVGYVPQRAVLDPSLPVTVQEVVASGLVASLSLLQRIGRAQRLRVSEALARAGMEAHARARIGALSTGQQQRVLIARALVSDPEREVTLVLVSHDIGVVAKEVTKLACLNRRLIFHGRPGDFLSDAALTALYGPSVRIVSHDH